MYEDIAGIRTKETWGTLGTLGAASTTEVQVTRVMMMKPFTLVGVGIMAATTNPAGQTTRLRVWVNGVRKGTGQVTLTSGAGAGMSVGNNFGITGPANSVLGLSVASAAATAGSGIRFQYRYHHGFKA